VDLREQFGSNLRRIREEAGFSQEDLMRVSDVHRTQISKYERGETDPQLEVLVRLSEALNVPIADLLAGIGWQGH
jgi:transcriptional regulator with XRE-family HTH domain